MRARLPKIASVLALLVTLFACAVCCDSACAQDEIKTWIGVTSTKFTEDSNWDPAGTPNGDETLVISSDDACKFDMEITDDYSGTPFTALEIPSDAKVNVIVYDGGSITFNGDITALSESVFFTMAGGTVYVGGSVSGAEYFQISGGELIFNGAGSQSIANLSAYDLTFSGSGTYSISGSMAVSGTATLNSGTLSCGSSTITLYGPFSSTGGTFNAGTGTVVFAGSVAHTLPSVTFYNVTINKTNTTDTVSMSANRTISNNLTLTKGILSTGANILYVGKDWFHNGGTLNNGTGQVRFNGSGNSTISGTGTPSTFFIVGAYKSTTTAKLTLNSAIDVNGALLANTGIVEINGVTITAGSGVSTGTLVEPNGTLDLINSSSILETSANGVFAVQGKFVATVSSGQAKLRAIGGTGPVDVLFYTGATIDINGLKVQHMDAFGFEIQDGVTITQLKNIEFANGPGGVSGHLVWTDSDVTNFVLRGAKFDNTAMFNFYLADPNGDDDSISAHASVEFINTATNGTYAGEAYDFDDDANDDNIPDNGGAVIEWKRAATVLGTGVTGMHDPVTAFDHYSFNFVGTYVMIDAYDGTNHQIGVLDANSQLQNTYTVSAAAHGTLHQQGVFRTFDESEAGWDVNGNGAEETNVDTFAFATKDGAIDGKVYMLINDYDGGGGLDVPGGSSPWKNPYDSDDVAYKFLTANSGPIIDENYMFINGRDDSSNFTFFAVLLKDKSEAFTVNTAANANVDPAFLPDSGQSRVFSATLASGNSYVYDIGTGSGSIDFTYVAGTSPLRGGVGYSGTKICVGGDDDKMHGVLLSDFSAASGWPYSTGNGGDINAAPFIDYFSDKVFFNDEVGYVYGLNSNASTMWTPFRPSGAADVFSEPLIYLFDSPNRIFTGADNGVVWEIDADNGAVLKKHTLQTGVSVTGLSYNFQRQTVMVCTDNGIHWEIEP